MRRIVRTAMLSLAAILALAGCTLLVRPQDFLVLIGGGFLGSGSAAPILLLVLAVLLTLATLRMDKGAERSRTRNARWALIAMSGVLIAATLVRENVGFTATVLHFNSGDVPLVGTLIVPTGRGGSLPGIVIAHGSIDQPRRVLRRLAVTLARRAGAAVLYFDKRGVGESGGRYIPGGEATPENLDKRADDLAAAVNALARQPGVDSGRIGVLGVSQAGWVVPITATKTNTLRFALLISGPTLSVGQENYFSRAIEVGGDHFGWKAPPIPLEEGERLTARQPSSGFEPLPYLARMRIPTMWLFGEWDNSGPVQLYAARIHELQAQGVPIETYTFPQGNHGLFVARGANRGWLPHLAPGAWDSIGTWLSTQANAPRILDP